MASYSGSTSAGSGRNVGSSLGSTACGCPSVIPYANSCTHALLRLTLLQGKDQVQLCSLNNFDAYIVTRINKAPKPYVFAVKSTDNISFFESTSDYVHVFSCDTKEGDNWVEKILLARVSTMHVGFSCTSADVYCLVLHSIPGPKRSVHRICSCRCRRVPLPFGHAQTPCSASAELRCRSSRSHRASPGCCTGLCTRVTPG